jgi:hypothetical protein
MRIPRVRAGVSRNVASSQRQHDAKLCLAIHQSLFVTAVGYAVAFVNCDADNATARVNYND